MDLCPLAPRACQLIAKIFKRGPWIAAYFLATLLRIILITAGTLIAVNLPIFLIGHFSPFSL